jgi:hypothetical protein
MKPLNSPKMVSCFHLTTIVSIGCLGAQLDRPECTVWPWMISSMCSTIGVNLNIFVGAALHLTQISALSRPWKVHPGLGPIRVTRHTRLPIHGPAWSATNSERLKVAITALPYFAKLGNRAKLCASTLLASIPSFARTRPMNQPKFKPLSTARAVFVNHQTKPVNSDKTVGLTLVLRYMGVFPQTYTKEYRPPPTQLGPIGVMCSHTSTSPLYTDVHDDCHQELIFTRR